MGNNQYDGSHAATGQEADEAAASSGSPLAAQGAQHGGSLPESLILLAEAVASAGGRALLVGGYARDEALRRLGHEAPTKDFDMEVFGLPLPRLAEVAGAFGEVHEVGASFGVLKLRLPSSGIELDLSIPRRDSKRGHGHRGFKVEGDPDMTFAEAALRRDLTINAIGYDPLTGELQDPYGGLRDLEAGLLRAVDPNQFGEDPLRVLRVMSFSGRLGFSIDPDTVELCRNTPLSDLSRERIGEEWRKLLLCSPRPSVGLEAARELRIIQRLHPELDGLWEVPQEPEWHPEGNVWEHVKLTVDAAARIVREDGLTGEDAAVVLYGALCHDLGKKTTTIRRKRRGTMRWTSDNHEREGVEPARSLLRALDVPHRIRDKVLPIVRYHLYHIHAEGPEGRVPDSAVRKLADKLSPATIAQWDLVSQSDANGSGRPWDRNTGSRRVYERSRELNVDRAPAVPLVQGRDLIAEGLTPGPVVGQALREIYERQLEGVFSTRQEALAWWRANGSGRSASS